MTTVCSMLSPIWLVPMESWDPGEHNMYITQVYEKWPWSSNSSLNQGLVISLDQILHVFHCF